MKTLALVGDVAAHGGGTQIVSGSHRPIHAWLRDRPPPADARRAEIRQRLRAQPYLRDLHSPSDTAERVARFMDRETAVDGIPLRVVELTGAAGDVFLLHPLLLHVAAPDNGSAPRLLLSGGVTTDLWGWG